MNITQNNTTQNIVDKIMEDYACGGKENSKITLNDFIDFIEIRYKNIYDNLKPEDYEGLQELEMYDFLPIEKYIETKKRVLSKRRCLNELPDGFYDYYEETHKKNTKYKCEICEEIIVDISLRDMIDMKNSFYIMKRDIESGEYVDIPVDVSNCEDYIAREQKHMYECLTCTKKLCQECRVSLEGPEFVFPSPRDIEYMETWENDAGENYKYLGGLIQGIPGENCPVICPFCNTQDTRNSYGYDHELVMSRLQLLNEIKGVDSNFFVKKRNKINK